MYTPVQQMGYDRAITVFSPDGRLFQVEYAREAIRIATTSIGIVCTDGIVLIAHKRLASRLVVSDSHEKIYQVDKHIAAAASGLAADARALVNQARVETQKHRLSYSEDILVETLAKKLGDQIQFFTQYGGFRPYGVSLLLAGIDSTGARLFETDPSGALFEFKATAIGGGKKVVDEFFEKEYFDEVTVAEGLKLGLKALKKVVEEKLSKDVVDITVIEKKGNAVKELSKDEIAKVLAEAKA